MKRFWIGITVLVVLLASGWGIAFFMERCHTPISQELALAARTSQQEQAIQLSQSAHTRWLRCRDFTAAFADHNVLEQIDAIFAEIEIYAAAGDTLAFRAACAHLAELSKAVAESHCPKWQNLL